MTWPVLYAVLLSICRKYVESSR